MMTGTEWLALQRQKARHDRKLAKRLKKLDRRFPEQPGRSIVQTKCLACGHAAKMLLALFVSGRRCARCRGELRIVPWGKRR